MHAETLNCASCGAAVSSESPVCLHCGARLATMVCPSCFQMMVTGSKFCRHCGNVAVAWEPGPDSILCPGCETPLLSGRLGPLLLHQCGKCFGFWVEKLVFEQICKDAERQAAVLDFPEKPVPISGPGLPKIKYVRCPKCRTFMNRVNFAEYSGVVVDVCRADGTWFEMNELQRIVQFVHQGGMDQARERQKASFEAERRRLETRRLSQSQDPAPVFISLTTRPESFSGMIRFIVSV